MKIIKQERPKVGEVLLHLRPVIIAGSRWIQTEIDLQMTISPNRPNFPLKVVNGLPEPEAWTKQLATGIAEVLIGERPVFQLMRWVSFDVYQEIDRQIKTRKELHAKRSRPFVRSLRIENTSDKIIEATAVIQKGSRGRGMGLRLEAENDRWRCTQLLVA
ncbi:MAG: hypothetical protein RIS18_328 [Actinomycetota bacterium]|jgi:hypothetical protein